MDTVKCPSGQLADAQWKPSDVLMLRNKGHYTLKLLGWLSAVESNNPSPRLEDAVLFSNEEGHYGNIILKFYMVSIHFILSEEEFLC